MKQILLAVAVIAGVFITNISSAQSRTPHITHKEVKQNHKIKKGIHDGRITLHEAHRLRMKQAEIHGMQKMARVDGKVTHRERRLMRKEQHQLGHMTAYSMHNHRNMGDHFYSHNGDRRDGRFNRMGKPQQQETLPPGYFN